MGRSRAGRLVAVCAACLLVSASLGQTDTQPTDTELLKDFIHYVKIARYDAAELTGQTLIARGVTPAAFADLLDTSGELQRFRSAVGEAIRAGVGGELEATAAALDRLYERGRLERARNPEEILANIELLQGQAQGRWLATQRLLAAGEYAVPQLFEALVDSGNPRLQATAQQILVDFGVQSVMPLCVAIVNVDPARQELVADVLGLKGYRIALPFLADVRDRTDSPAVREACVRAIDRLGGDGGASVSALYAELAEAFYAERPEVTSFPGETHQLLWSYTSGAPGTTLTPTGILTEVYHEAMAMRCAERALELDSGDLGAMALWVAANFKRLNETPEGYDNPAYPASHREPMYFAVASGMPVDQRVLARALDTRNTPLARQAIEAIARIAGGSQLWAGMTDRRPLLEALSYPNRRVQYDAALALGAAQPSSGFDGAERVVPILAGAIRDAASRYAVVVTSEQDQYELVRGVLEGEGYTVLPRGSTLAEVEAPIADAPGIDVVVSALAREGTVGLIESARYSPRLSATPVLALLPSDELPALQPLFDRDPTVALRRAGLSGGAIAESVRGLVEAASGGPISGEEASSYARRALGVVRDLAVSGGSVFDVREATGSLVGALGHSTGELKLGVSDALSAIADARAQRAIVEAALASQGPEQTALLGIAATSARRSGNMLEDRHVQRIIALARSEQGDVALAAASLLGALGLPNADLLPLMLD